MKFSETSIEGAYEVDPERRVDHRGFFARIFCERTFVEAGLESRFVQINNSTSVRRGTLRGLHYQEQPHAEAKLMRVVRGAIFDVIVDVRSGSPSFGKWFGAQLDDFSRRMMYVPPGCAHGFLSLTEDVEVIYMSSAYYAPAAERGVRFDDPSIGIVWPIRPVDVSDKDRAWPNLVLAQPAVGG